jgi:heme-degrading monooxygenase HmoA
MMTNDQSEKAGRMYRVDKFIVPDASRDEFLAGVHRTHAFLATLKGFVQDFLIEKRHGPETFNVMTIAEWDSEQSFHDAVATMRKRQADMGTTREERWARLGITPDLGDYRTIAD